MLLPYRSSSCVIKTNSKMTYFVLFKRHVGRYGHHKAENRRMSCRCPVHSGCFSRYVYHTKNMKAISGKNGTHGDEK